MPKTDEHLRSIHEERRVLGEAFQAVQTECLSLYQEMKTALGDEYFVEYDIIAPVLFKALRTGKNEEIRLAAARFLNRCGSPGLSELTPDLLGAAQDELPDIRLAALSCLDSFSLKGQEAAIPVLKGAMKDPDARIRLAAVKAWRGLGLDLASEGITTLSDLLKDQEAAVRHEALSVLAWLAVEAAAAIPAIVNVFLGERDETAQGHAARALLDIDPEFASVTKKMAVVTAEADRERVLRTLRKIGPSARLQRRALEDFWNAAAHLEPASRPSDTEARDKWIYTQCCKGTLHKTIVANLEKHKKWQLITTTEGIRQAAIRYADLHGLPLPPRRQDR